MDTSQRISTLCDGDMRLIYQEFEDNLWTINEIQFEYFLYLYHNGNEKVFIAVRDMFTPVVLEQAEQAFKAFTESFGNITLLIDAPIRPLNKSFMADYRRAWRENCNNYRKLNRLPLIRRPRCRWRPRESRRKLDGLSPGIVIIDEYAFVEEGVVSVELHQRG